MGVVGSSTILVYQGTQEESHQSMFQVKGKQTSVWLQNQQKLISWPQPLLAAIEVNLDSTNLGRHPQMRETS